MAIYQGRFEDKIAMSFRELDKKYKIYLAILVIFATIFRFYNLNWDGPHQFHSDERNVVTSIESVYFKSFSDFNLDPKFYVYGTFPVYLAKVVLVFSKWIGSEIGPDVAARIISAIMSVLSIPAVFFLALSFYNPLVALISAAFMTLNVQLIQAAHFGTVESALLTLLVMSILYSRKIQVRGRWRDYILAGFFIGLGVATKFSAITYFIPALIAHLSRCFKEGFKATKYLWKRFLVAMGVAILTSFIFFPHFYLKFRSFLAAMNWEGGIVNGRIVANYVYQFEKSLPFLYQLKHLFLWHMGPPMALFCIAGFFYLILKIHQYRNFEDFAILLIIPIFFISRIITLSLLKAFTFSDILTAIFTLILVILISLVARKRDNSDLLLLAWCIIYFGIIGAWRVKFMRYMVPMVPFFCIAGAKFILDLSEINLFQSKKRQILKAILGTVLTLSFLYAIAFLQVYNGDNTRIQATKWLEKNGGNKPNIITEYWDDAIPIPAGASNYVFNLFEDDNYWKTQEIAEELSKADFVVLSSQRVFASIFKMAKAYPTTTEYYRLLFSGKLGFDLVATFTSYPRLLGISLIDDYAEGSFEWVDHPKVHIFKNIKRYDRDTLLRLLQAKHPDLAALTVKDLIDVDFNQGITALGKLMGAKIQSAYEKSEVTPAPPRERKPFFLSRYPIFYWWLVVELIGLIAFPLTFIILCNLPDRGFVVSKTLGIVIVVFFTWISVSLGIVEFSHPTVIASILFMLCISLIFFVRNQAGILEFLKKNWKLILFQEGLFTFTYLVFLLIRSYNPDLYWSEKPMDLSFINIILRSKTFPPMDPWFSGYVINYYYFGHIIVATLIKLTEIPTHYAFNLMMGLIPALVIISAFCIIRNLTGSKFYGFAAGIFAGVFGNYDGLVQVWNKGFKNFDWWHPAHEIIPNTINEFPYWSFLFSDLHAHVIVMPFFMLLICVEYSLFMAEGRGFSLFGRKENFFLSYLFIAIALGMLFPTNAWDWMTHLCLLFLVFFAKDFFYDGSMGKNMVKLGNILSRLALLLFAGIGEGFNYLKSFLNKVLPKKTAPRRLITVQELQVVGGILLVKEREDNIANIENAEVAIPWYKSVEIPRIDWLYLVMDRPWRFLKNVLLPVAPLGILTFILYRPFFANYNPIKYGVGWVEQYTTKLSHFLIIFGFFLFCTGIFLILDYLYRLQKALIPLIKGLTIRAFIWAAILCAIYFYARWVLRYNWAVVVLLIPLIYLALTALASRFEQPKDRFALIILLMGLLIAIGVELVHVVDFMGKGPHRRMNTLFKFHLHSWLLLSTISGYALYKSKILFRSFALSFTARNLIRLAYYPALIFLTLSALIYPILGTHAKLFIEKRFTLGDIPTLDGFSYKKNELPSEYYAMKWLMENVQGTPVILEATGEAHEYYLDFNRVAMNTGLPSLLGWNSHVSQWNHPGSEIVERREDIRRIYETQDIEEALELIDKYDIKYIYIGNMEKKQYKNKGFEKFDRYKEFFTLRYQNEGVKIFEVINRKVEGPKPESQEEMILATGAFFRGGIGSQDGQFDQPSDIVIDHSGNFYIADTMNHRIQKFTNNGIFSKKWGSYGGDPGQFRYPRGLGISPDGNILVADSLNDRIQVFSPNGELLLLIDDKDLYEPTDVTVDQQGNIYVTNSGYGKIMVYDRNGRKLRSFGEIGRGKSQFRQPSSILIGKDQNIYVHDLFNERVQVLTPEGKFIKQWNVLTSADVLRGYPFMAQDSKGFIYITDPPRDMIYKYTNFGELKAKYTRSLRINAWSTPTGIYLDSQDNAYIVSSADGRIIKKEKPEIANMANGAQGIKPGMFNEPRDCDVDEEGNIYVADFRNFRVQKFDSEGNFITMWGSKGDADGQFNDPCGIAVSKDGFVYVADTWNHRIQKFDGNGQFLAKWVVGLSAPRGIETDEYGNVYVADSGNCRIVKLDPEGNIIRSWGGTRGNAPSQFSEPIGIVVDDKNDRVFVVDTWNRRIQVFDRNGRFIEQHPVNLWEGEAFREPYIDIFGDNIYVSDPPANRIVKFNRQFTKASYCNVPPARNKFAFPMGIATQKNGDIIVVDTWNHRVLILKDTDFR